MKDLHVDVDDAGLQASTTPTARLLRIFDRLGPEYVIVQATSGAMGGSASSSWPSPR